MAASLAIFGGLVISCATSTSLRFWVQVTHILSNLNLLTQRFLLTESGVEHTALLYINANLHIHGIQTQQKKGVL